MLRSIESNYDGFMTRFSSHYDSAFPSAYPRKPCHTGPAGCHIHALAGALAIHPGQACKYRGICYFEGIVITMEDVA